MPQIWYNFIDFVTESNNIIVDFDPEDVFDHKSCMVITFPMIRSVEDSAIYEYITPPKLPMSLI